MLAPTEIRRRIPSLTFTILLALCLVAAGCSSDSTPAELPFSETTIPAEDRLDTGAVEEADSATSTGSEGADVSEVFSAVERDADVADCQDAVFAEAGITEVDDLSDFAAQSAKLSPADQQRLADCVNNG